jgi:hypothetical protein
MRLVRLVLVSSALIAAGAAALGQAARAATLRVGAADGPNAVFVFDEKAKSRAFVLRTTRFGVAGSRIEVTVDQAREPVFRHIFAPGECKFAESGSACEVTIAEKDAAYRAIFARFKRGRLARVTVQDAGVTKMDQTVALKGFANALR